MFKNINLYAYKYWLSDGHDNTILNDTLKSPIQDEVAESAIKKGVKEGGWVVLQNVHHASNWLPRLSSIITNLFDVGNSQNNEKIKGLPEIHHTFRLILTSQPSDLVLQ